MTIITDSPLLARPAPRPPLEGPAKLNTHFCQNKAILQQAQDKANIDNIINTIAQKGIGKTKSISIKLDELETQREDLERDIDNIGFEIDKIRQQVFNAQVIHQSLVKFSQIYDKAEPMDLKELLPNFVERIIWKPTEIEIALFDHEIQRGQVPSINHSGKNALEFVDWLPRRDARRTTQLNEIPLLVRIYKRRSRSVELSLGVPFPESTPKTIKKPKNIARIALDIKAYLTINLDASYSTAAEHYNISRARISQLLKIANNLPTRLLKELVESDNPALLKKYSGRKLLKLSSSK